MVAEYEHLRVKLLDRLSIGGFDACWEWQGSRSMGYGLVWDHVGKRSLRVHRVTYAMWRDSVPADLQIDHLCRNKACANPRHLEVVTPQLNTLRGFGVTAENARKTHCKRGHELTQKRTYRGWRVCRLCEHERRRRERQLAALRPSEVSSDERKDSHE